MWNWNTCLDSAKPSSSQARPPLTSSLFTLTTHLHDGEDEGQVRWAVKSRLVVNIMMLSSALFLESPPLPPPGSVICRRTLTAQPIVLPTAMTYCRKRTQNKAESAKRMARGLKSWTNPAQASKRYLAVEAHGVFLIPQNEL